MTHAVNRMRNGAVRLLCVWIALMACWWVALNVTGRVDTMSNYLYGVALGLLPVFGGLIGLARSRDWGGWASAMGKACLFLGLGLVSWGVGTLIFAYYNIVGGIEVPYPSLADAAYIVSWPLWVVGVIELAKATGAHFSMRRMAGKLQLVLVPIVIAAVSYYLLITVARGGSFDLSEGFSKSFFDLAYPIGDLVILTAAALVFGLSRQYLGGRYKVPVLVVLAGFVLNYAADFSFSLTTTMETFYVANWVDLLFTTAMAALSIGVALLDPENGRNP